MVQSMCSSEPPLSTLSHCCSSCWHLSDSLRSSPGVMQSTDLRSEPPRPSPDPLPGQFPDPLGARSSRHRAKHPFRTPCSLPDPFRRFALSAFRPLPSPNISQHPPSSPSAPKPHLASLIPPLRLRWQNINGSPSLYLASALHRADVTR
ncbi:hypothetical protein CALVIDRAFT_370192 [Calocera viscosa TUFC12733]|uniref:Uncharacterized protein n=1 Tax=Calocera viscosa (strain TUFC12733) TaxID=1330018 RepID=A0A167GXY0_CALVF|nr:hypothetical protein CALVIDRAFT_370192 [Calocera viscosa TUFC12733]